MYKWFRVISGTIRKYFRRYVIRVYYNFILMKTVPTVLEHFVSNMMLPWSWFNWITSELLIIYNINNHSGEFFETYIIKLVILKDLKSHYINLIL